MQYPSLLLSLAKLLDADHLGENFLHCPVVWSLSALGHLIPLSFLVCQCELLSPLREITLPPPVLKPQYNTVLQRSYSEDFPHPLLPCSCVQQLLLHAT